MDFTTMALTGFSAGLGFASVVACLMSGYLAARHSLAEL